MTLGVGLRMMRYYLPLLVVRGLSSRVTINDNQHPRIGISSMLSVDSLSQAVPGLKARASSCFRYVQMLIQIFHGISMDFPC